MKGNSRIDIIEKRLYQIEEFLGDKIDQLNILSAMIKNQMNSNIETNEKLTQLLEYMDQRVQELENVVSQNLPPL